MAFAFGRERAGVATERLATTAKVRLTKQGAGFVFDRIALVLEATAQGA